MAYDVGAIVARIMANPEGFMAGMNAVDQKLEESEKKAKATANGYAMLATAGTAVASAVAAMTVVGIKSNAQMEQLSMSFRVLLKDEQKAAQAMEYLNKLADQSPFLTMDVVSAGRQMVAYGVDLEKYMTTAMNLAAGMGANLQDVAAAFGRLASGAMGEAFERLRQLGITTKELMAEGLVFDAGGQLKSSAEEAMEAVKRVVEEKFGGMVEAQSRTWEGLVSTLKSKLVKFARESSADVFTPLKGVLTGLVDSLSGMSPAAAKAAGGLMTLAGVLGAIVAGTAAWALAQNAVTRAFAGTGFAAKALLTNPWFLAIAGIATVAIGIKTLVDTHRAAQAEARKTAAANEDLLESYEKIQKQLDKTIPGTKEHTELEKKLQEAINDLAQALNGIGFEYDELGNARIKDIELIRDQIDKEKELERTRAENENKDKLRRKEREVEQARAAVAAAKQWGTDLANPKSAAYQRLMSWGRVEGQKMLQQAQLNQAKALEEANRKLREALAEQNKLMAELGLAPATAPTTGGVGGTTAADTAARLAARQELADKLFALTHTELEAELRAIDQQAAEYRKAGLAEVDIKKWASLEKDRINKEYAKKAADVAEQMRQEQIAWDEDFDRQAQADWENEIEHEYRMGEMTLDQLIQEYELMLDVTEEANKRRQIEERILELKKQQNEETAAAAAGHVDYVGQGVGVAGNLGNPLAHGNWLGAAVLTFGDALDELAVKVLENADTFGQVVSAMAAGNWVGAIAALVSGTKSFSALMKILNIVLKPVLDLLDMILMPILRFIAGIWNAIMGALAGINIFGWRPFGGLSKYIINIDDNGEVTTPGDGQQPGGNPGTQIAQWTGPDRDLLMSMLSPLTALVNLPAYAKEIIDRLTSIDLGIAGLPARLALAGAGGIVWNIDTLNVQVPNAPANPQEFFGATGDQASRGLNQGGGA